MFPRAVHLEPAYQLITDSLIQAIIRLIARQDNPRLIVSDNSRNFVGASREPDKNKKQFHHQEVIDRILKEAIE